MPNDETMKQVYLLAQEHCGLEVGDWVRVMREPENHEAGWDNTLVYDVKDMLGKIYKIDDINPLGVAVRYANDFVRYFPFFVLEKTGKPKHEFKPFDRVLGRDDCVSCWTPDFLSFYDESCILPYKGMRGDWEFCLPYEGNEHLVGTTNEPEE